MDKAIIITTINPPKDEIHKFAKIPGWKLICVGDTKTPLDWQADNVDYISPEMQDRLFPLFSKVFPWGLYARKNLGYLYAIKSGAKLVAETDDDMFPDKGYPPDLSLERTVTVLSGKKFINVYPHFLKTPPDHPVWIRGFPLECLKDQEPVREKKEKVITPIQNSVLDKNSDFDAVYRFLYPEWLELKKEGEYAIDKGSYAPFNTQNTFFHEVAFPLLYLPATPGFHAEDIIRSYIAQRLVWEIDGRLVFTPPVQHTLNRNPHDNLDDFRLEVPVFLKVKQLVEILDSLSLSKDLLDSLLKTYTILVRKEFFPKEELPIVTAWVCEMEELLTTKDKPKKPTIPFRGLVDYTTGEPKYLWGSRKA